LNENLELKERLINQ